MPQIGFANFFYAQNIMKSVGGNLGRITNMTKLQKHYVANEKGQKTAVILPVEEYEELLRYP